MNINKYATHYEITDYTLGDCPALEKMLSVWDDKTFSNIIYYHYDTSKSILYIPTGINEFVLRQLLDEPVDNCFEVNDKAKASFIMNLEPRNISQKQAIRFLLGKGEYSYTKSSNQLVLSLPGGGGKTFCAVAALSNMNTKGIIITDSDEIRKQWLSRILQYTNLTEDNVVLLTSTDKLKSLVDDKRKRALSKNIIYLVTHRLLGSYMKRYGFDSLNQAFIKLGIGVKIIDEAHKEFRSTLMIDYATNVAKSFYLTATFIRSDPKENKVFQNAFNSLYKLVLSDEDIGHERNVLYIAYIIKSKITPIEAQHMNIKKTFSVQRYFQYENKYMELFDAVEYWLKWYYDQKGFNGKTFILSSKKDSCDISNKIATELFPDKRVSVHYTGSKVNDLMDYDIISATDRMLGTGIDLSGLGMIINLVPISSHGNIDQIIHRLMRGNSNDTAYYIEIIDWAVPHTIDMYYRRSKIIRKIVKKAVTFRK